jgi:hypothetical protein
VSSRPQYSRCYSKQGRSVCSALRPSTRSKGRVRAPSTLIKSAASKVMWVKKATVSRVSLSLLAKKRRRREKVRTIPRNQ